MIPVKLLKVRGQAAVVSYRDEDGTIQGRVVSKDDVAGMRIGETRAVLSDVVDSGTEYGLDLEVLLGEECVITPRDIEQEFRKHNIWTYDDMNSNSQVVFTAINTLIRKVYAELLREAR